MANEKIELIIQAKDQASPAFGKVTGNVIGLNQALEVSQKAFSAISVAVSKTVGAYAKFETTLSKIKVTSKATTKEINAIEKAALDLGASTLFSASQVAEGFLVLAKSGKTVDQQLNLIKPTLDLATSGTIELAEAASFLSSTMGQFALNSKDATRIANTFVAASSSADQSVSQFAEALKQGGQTAKAAGFSFEETAILISALAESGVKASEAGTAVRGFSVRLARLGEAAGEQKKIMRELGLSFSQVNPQTNKLSVVFENLSKKLIRGRDPIDALNDAIILFGEEAGPKFIKVLRDGGPALDRMRDSFNGAANASDTARDSVGKTESRMIEFNNLLDSINTTIGKMSASFIQASLDITNSFLKSIDSLLKKLSLAKELFDKVTKGQDLSIFGEQLVALASLAKAWTSVGDAAGKAGGKIGEANGIQTKTIGAIADKLTAWEEALFDFQDGAEKLFAGIGKQAAGKVAGLSGAVQGAQTAGPIGAVVGGGMELLLSNEKLNKSLGKISEVLVKLVDPIAEALAPALEALVPLLSALSPVFKLIGKVLAISLVPLVEQIKILSHWMRQLIGALGGAFGGASKGVESFGEESEKAARKVGDAFTGLGESLGKLLPGLWDSFNGLWDGLSKSIEAIDLGGALEGIGKAFEGLVPLFAGALQGIGGLLGSIWDKITEAFRSVFSQSGKIIENIWDKISEIFGAIFNQFGSGVTNIWDKLRSILDPIFSRFGAGVTNIWDKIRDVFSGIFSQAGEGVTNIWDKISLVFSKIFNNAASFSKNIWTEIRNAFSKVFENVTGFAGNLWDSISSAFNRVFKDVGNVGRTILTKLKDAFQKIWDAILAYPRVVTSKLSAAFLKIWDVIRNASSMIFNSLRSAFNQLWAAIRTYHSTLTSAINGAFQKIWNAITGASVSIFNSLKDSFKKIWDMFSTAPFNIFNDLKKAFGDIFEKLASFDLVAWAKNLFGSIWDSILEMLGFKKKGSGKSDTVKFLQEGADKGIDSFQKKLDESNPFKSSFLGGNIVTAHEGGLLTQNDLFRMPGMAPNEGLIKAQSGERILSRADTGGTNGAPVNITFNVRSINPESQKEEIRQMLEEMALTGRLRIA